MTDDIEAAARLLHDTHNVLLFLGAGASAGSGLPTFEDANMEDYGIDKWRSTLEWRNHIWAMIRKFEGCEPNDAHLAAMALQDAGRGTICTSNIDGLALPAIEVCGSVRRTRQTTR